MSDLENKAVELLDKLDKLATQYTPEVADTASKAVMISSIGELIAGLLLIVISICLYFGCVRLFGYFARKKEEGGFHSNWEIGMAAVAVFGGIAVFVCAVSGIENLIYICLRFKIF